MKFNFSILLVTMLMFTASSCSYFETTVLPKAKEKAAQKLTEAIVKVGECEDASAVSADVHKWLKTESDDGALPKALAGESGSSQKSSLLGGTLVQQLCRSAVSLAVPALMEKATPEDWKCKLTDLSSKAMGLADKACSKT